MKWIELLQKNEHTNEEFLVMVKEFKEWVHSVHCKQLGNIYFHYWGCTWLKLVEEKGVVCNDLQHLYKLRHVYGLIGKELPNV